MKTIIQSVNFNADQELLDFCQRKCDKLDHFFDRIVEGEVFLKTENTSEKENKIAEIKLNVPGKELVVKKKNKTFEAAIDQCVDGLERQLKKHKEKIAR